MTAAHYFFLFRKRKVTVHGGLGRHAARVCEVDLGGALATLVHGRVPTTRRNGSREYDLEIAGKNASSNAKKCGRVAALLEELKELANAGQSARALWTGLSRGFWVNASEFAGPPENAPNNGEYVRERGRRPCWEQVAITGQMPSSQWRLGSLGELLVIVIERHGKNDWHAGQSR